MRPKFSQLTSQPSALFRWLQSAWERLWDSLLDVPNAYTFASPDWRGIPTIKSSRSNLTLARSKKTIHLPASFDVQVEEWQQFIDRIPGRKFDGVDIGQDESGDVVIVAGYGLAGADDRRLYTAGDKADMEAFAAAQSANVTNIAG